MQEKPRTPIPKPPAQVIVLVDHAALIRGWTEEGETCWIEGVGAVPVATVKAMQADCFLSVVVKDSTDIRKVVHLGRSPTTKQRTALVARDRECVVPGCGIRNGLEIDHTTGWVPTYQTRLDQLARLCHHHHFLKTHRGFRPVGEPGHWTFLPPDSPDSTNPTKPGAGASLHPTSSAGANPLPKSEPEPSADVGTDPAEQPQSLF